MRVTPATPKGTTPDEHPPTEGERGAHHWMMIACCIPMLVLAVVLVATGVVSGGFVFVALLCMVMMAMIMRGMNRAQK